MHVCVCVSLQRLIAFRNITANTCYIDRLDETFAEGYARWEGYEVCLFICVWVWVWVLWLLGAHVVLGVCVCVCVWQGYERFCVHVCV